MFINTKYRSTRQEDMDDLSMEGDLLQNTLDQLVLINKRLGGNKATINGLHTLLKAEPKDAAISIVDLGCGSGDILRAVADYGRKNNYTFKLTGIDANEYTVNYARKLSVKYPEISFIKMDVQSIEFSGLSFDIGITTLFLHHFTNQEIDHLLIPIVKKARIGVVINDLHRSSIAYYLFKAVCLFIKNPMVKKDGAISVLRGFKKNELIHISKKLNNTVSSIRWRWAFRYQWIIKKT
ncbi:MAG: methyltransferase domain-containing protein [Chitinophagaceae bacterium]|nr:methyltransferase domain-containing protein [Chitinophagaceae bacterium]MBK8786772.1 methyltransferase domain-containing protein [Chitinophagaceae bacterium]MBK9486087.1 methyltransferase domain-containing protein [Chitinophagaceae bacterium]MBL0202649.1 methyltransferase domain-containing protein [Chitinophagaceae bacterium]